MTDEEFEILFDMELLNYEDTAEESFAEYIWRKETVDHD